MADNYTQFSTAISLPNKDAFDYAMDFKRKLDEGGLCPEYPDFFDDDWECLCDFIVESDRSPDGFGLWIHDDEGSGNPEAAANYIQVLLAKYWPQETHQFTFACTCSKPRIDEFGGGAFFITPDKSEGMSTWDWAHQKHKEWQSKAA